MQKLQIQGTAVKEYAIGQLSRRTGVKVATILYYEGRALIPLPERTQGGQRRHDETALEQSAFRCNARELGHGLDDIADLMALAQAPEEDCAPAHEIARTQLAEVDRCMAIHVRLRKDLATMAEADDAESAGECCVIQALGDHRLCIAAHEAYEYLPKPKGDQESASASACPDRHGMLKREHNGRDGFRSLAG